MPVKVTPRDDAADQRAHLRRWPGKLRDRWTGRQAVPAAPSQALAYQGISFNEAGSDRNGLWTAARFSLPVPMQGAGALRFEAFHPESLFLQAEAHEAPTAKPPVTWISFHLAGREIASYVVEGEGDFGIDLILPPPRRPVAVLDIAVSRSFRPGVIWQSADARTLSLLLKLVRVDGLAVVDHTAARAMPVEDIVGQLPGINVIGYVKAEMGLGEAARACVRSAQAAGIPVSVLDAGFQTLHRQQDGVDGGDGTVHPVNLLHVNAEQCGPLRQYLANERPEFLRADYTIGYWAWEQPDFPTDYLPCFEGLDEIWTPSSFVQAAIGAIAPVPVLRMPHAVAASASPLARRATFGLPEGMFLALVTYDFYSYQHRKNPQAAIAAYRQAKDEAGVAIGLVIKTINGDKVPAALEALRQELTDVPDVVFIDRYLDRQAMFDLEACCDCLLSLHRAEGFGLGLAEMMCLGKPVIATNWSGNVDFMNAGNAMPVDYTLAPLAHDTGPYRAGSLWAEADPHHAAAQLLRLAGDPALARSIGRRAQADMACYSAAAIGRLFRRRLALIEVTARNGRTRPGRLSRPGA